jgi:hypothetical protein
VAYPHLSVWASVRLPNCNDTSRMPVEQISPDKDVNFRYTTAAFTLSPEPGASLCRANLPGDWALYTVSVRWLIALRSGFLRAVPRGNAPRGKLRIFDLPSASIYVNDINYQQGSHTGDFHPISPSALSRSTMRLSTGSEPKGSRPCRAYTSASSRR